MNVRKPMTPQDVCPKIANVGVHISIPTVNYDENGRPSLGHKTIDLLHGNAPVGRPAK
jgi:hypothetical protein